LTTRLLLFIKKPGRRDFAPTGVFSFEQPASGLVGELNTCLQTMQEDRAIRIDVANLIRRDIRRRNLVKRECYSTYSKHPIAAKESPVAAVLVATANSQLAHKGDVVVFVPEVKGFVATVGKANITADWGVHAIPHFHVVAIDTHVGIAMQSPTTAATEAINTVATKLSTHRVVIDIDVVRQEAKGSGRLILKIGAEHEILIETHVASTNQSCQRIARSAATAALAATAFNAAAITTSAGAVSAL